MDSTSLVRLIEEVGEWEKRGSGGKNERRTGNNIGLGRGRGHAGVDQGARATRHLQSDRELRLLSWNRWLEEHSGRAAAKVVGRPRRKCFLRSQGAGC